MNYKFLTTMTCLLLALPVRKGVSSPPLAEVINTEDLRAGQVSMAEWSDPAHPTPATWRKMQREERRIDRWERRIERYTTKAPDRLRGITDGTDRWFWLWTIGWGLGILLLILSGGVFSSAFLGILWLLGFVGGTACLVVWLVKRHGR